mmetsp:Transcript_28983/g.76608  ORF Transcript_28983/g.76608 Transcript_28983/m.76608 type:complete len:254 (+) Transcript_28983:1283-2044(+)
MSTAVSMGTDEDPFWAAATAACSAISFCVWRSASDAIRSGFAVQTRTIMSEQVVTTSPFGRAAPDQTVPAWMRDCLHERSETDHIFRVMSSEDEMMVWPSAEWLTPYTKDWWPASLDISQPSKDHILSSWSFDAVIKCVELAEMERMMSPWALSTLCFIVPLWKTRREQSCEPVTISPVGSTATVTAWAPASSVYLHSAVALSQTFALPSQAPVTSWAPHSTTEHTGPSWPTYCITGLPSSLHRTAVLSFEPE